MVTIARCCAEPGCNGVALAGRFCLLHTSNNYASRRDSRRGRENPETYAWYDLAAWRGKYGLRLWKLRETPVCEKCEREAATDVHHKDGSWREGGAGAWDKFMDRKNLEALCHRCHSEITAKEHLNA
jgi:5-methylcytosine-specific restriction enzyme A